MGRLALLLLLAAEATGPPSLTVRASPPMSLADIGTGCAPVLLVAEIRGPEVESWYCPRVEWTWPDGTVSATESDCPPFERRDECAEPQQGCGLVGWIRVDDGFRDVVKDCPCTRIGYPRRWSRRVCLPPTPTPDPWEITIRLYRDGRQLARQTVQAHVR